MKWRRPHYSAAARSHPRVNRGGLAIRGTAKGALALQKWSLCTVVTMEPLYRCYNGLSDGTMLQHKENQSFSSDRSHSTNKLKLSLEILCYGASNIRVFQPKVSTVQATSKFSGQQCLCTLKAKSCFSCQKCLQYNIKVLIAQAKYE